MSWECILGHKEESCSHERKHERSGSRYLNQLSAHTGPFLRKEPVLSFPTMGLQQKLSRGADFAGALWLGRRMSGETLPRGSSEGACEDEAGATPALNSAQDKVIPDPLDP